MLAGLCPVRPGDLGFVARECRTVPKLFHVLFQPNVLCLAVVLSSKQNPFSILCIFTPFHTQKPYCIQYPHLLQPTLPDRSARFRSEHNSTLATDSSKWGMILQHTEIIQLKIQKVSESREKPTLHRSGLSSLLHVLDPQLQEFLGNCWAGQTKLKIHKPIKAP